MTLIAKYNVQVRGHIYAKGESMEWDNPITPRIIDNFTAADGRELVLPQPPPDEKEATPPPPADELPLGDKEATPPGELPLEPPPTGEPIDEDALVKRTLDVLKRDGVMRQLDEMGVTYPANAKNTFLARLLLMSKGEIKAE